MNQYRTIDYLASTPNSELELAYDETNRRLCVIKKIINGEVEPYLSFLDINHPNLARIYEVDTQDNTVVMEYVEGAALPPDRLMSENEVRRIGISLCLALGELHKRNIIHRDIKPSNIIMTNNGNIKIIDYGTARVYKEGKGGDTSIFGTKGYAPPEQYGFGQTDFASDIYNVGVTMLRLLTGGIDEQSLNGYNGALKPIIKKCMSVDPSMRFSSADELRQALLGEIPATAHKKSKFYIIFVAAIAVLCVFGVLSSLPGLVKSILEPNAAETNIESLAEAIEIDSSGFNDAVFPLGVSSVRVQPYKWSNGYSLEGYSLRLFAKVTQNNPEIASGRAVLTFEFLDGNGTVLGNDQISTYLDAGESDVIDDIISISYDDGAFCCNGGKVSKIKLTKAELTPFN